MKRRRRWERIGRAAGLLGIQNTIKAKPMEIQRKLAQEPAALQDWFTQLYEMTQKLSIQPENMYNMDETGCRIGVATNQYVYSRNGRQIFIPNANNRELVTLVEAISSDGSAITSMVIVKAATVMEHWAVDLPDDYLIAVSESGYSNGKLALDWLQHFNKQTEKRRKGAWRLLLVDGHGSRETREFVKYAEDHMIQIFALPSHTTHILQPLDVGCFQPLKWYHWCCLDWAARTGSKDISKADFMATLEEIRRLTFTRTTILSGWRRTVISPYNPEFVLAQLRRQEECNSSDDERSPTPPLYLIARKTTPIIVSSPPLLASSPSQRPLPQVSAFHTITINLELAQRVRRPHPDDYTPEPPNPAPGSAAWHTPKIVRQIHAQEPFVQAVLREHLPREVAANVIKHQRGVSALARTAEGLKRELRRTEAARIAKEERRRRKRRVLTSKGGPVYSQDARAMVLQRQVDDQETELSNKSLREVTRIANKRKRLLPTIRNHGTKYFKRAANSVVIERDVRRWQHAYNDAKYNTTIQASLQHIRRTTESRFRENSTTIDQKHVAEVAFEVRRRVDPYTNFVAARLLERNASQDQDNSETNSEYQLQRIHQARLTSVKIESQTQPTELEDGGGHTSNSDGNSDCSNTASSEDMQNDWGLQ